MGLLRISSGWVEAGVKLGFDALEDGVIVRIGEG